MKYDFDTVNDRRGTNSYKWDTTPAGVTPMWVADMDFKTAPCIVEALRRRVDEGIFGYTFVPQAYYDAVVGWFGSRHGWKFSSDNIIYTSGVVPAVSAIIKGLTRPGDKVICQTPAYNCFFSSIRNNGCTLAANPLLYNNEDGSYKIDFDGLESLAADPAAKVLLFCNPHNPSGRVWMRAELERVAEICLRHGVTILADEIHCELTFDGHRYIPMASLSDEVAQHCITCVSPSKAFNIAGLQIASIVSANKELLRLTDRAINDNEVCDVNPFGVIATIEAYNHGAGWLVQLKDYIWSNYLYLRELIGSRLPAYTLTPLEGTYLAWLNISASGMTGAVLEKYLIDKARVRLNAGEMYGPEGRDFLRINLAAPRAILAPALQAVVDVLAQLPG